MRLVNVTHPEIKIDGIWVPICGHYFWENQNGAKLFCRKLGFANGEHKGRETGSLLSKPGYHVGYCKGSDTDLLSCTGTCATGEVGGTDCGNCNAGQHAGVEIKCINDKSVAPPISLRFLTCNTFFRVKKYQ